VLELLFVLFSVAVVMEVGQTLRLLVSLSSLLASTFLFLFYLGDIKCPAMRKSMLIKSLNQ